MLIKGEGLSVLGNRSIWGWPGMGRWPKLWGWGEHLCPVHPPFIFELTPAGYPLMSESGQMVLPMCWALLLFCLSIHCLTVHQYLHMSKRRNRPRLGTRLHFSRKLHFDKKLWVCFVCFGETKILFLCKPPYGKMWSEHNFAVRANTILDFKETKDNNTFHTNNGEKITTTTTTATTTHVQSFPERHLFIHLKM